MKRVYDVIIVGSGVAGCFAALHLPEDMDISSMTDQEKQDARSKTSRA